MNRLLPRSSCDFFSASGRLIGGFRRIDRARLVSGRADWELKERCLFHVAQTRARDSLAITGFGVPSPLLHGGE